METRELTCIGCPLGCALTVTMNGKEVVEVKGNTCKKGDIYAEKKSLIRHVSSRQLSESAAALLR